MEDTVPQLELETEVQINIHSSNHMDTVLSRLEEQRKKNFLCDITLVVETVQFRAHKALLAASSEYFSMMFADEGSIGQSIYVIEGVVSEVFETLLQFIYTGNVLVSEKCLKQIVGTAQVLKVDNLVKAYVEYQENLPKRDAEVSDNRTVDDADDPALKRKRGRPRKQSDQNNTQADSKSVTEKDTDNAAAPESMEDTCYTNGTILHEHEVADFAAEVTCDLNPKPPEEPLIIKRHSKRRSQRSVKLQDYRLGEDGEDRGSTKNSVGKKKQPTPEVSCKDCGKVFKYKHFLAIHRRTHTGECPFKCSQCGQGFSQKHSLRVHERIHTGERPYSCTVCSKSLATKNSLMEHMRIHADKKAFTCDKCGKFYSQKRQLKSHYRIHIGEKPFTCEVCGKSFTAKSSLLTHMRIHRGEKPYSCNICGKAFADSSAKRRHLTLHTGNKPFSCSKCSVQFTRMDNLKAHIKSHSKEKKPKPPTTTTSTRVEEGSRSVVEMQQYQIETPNPQEMQLLVAENVHNLNLMSGEGQGINIVTDEASIPNADHAENLPPQPPHQPPVLRGLPVASHQQQGQPIRNIDMMESRVPTVLPEQMHVVTLSKEAFDQLQGRTHEIHLTQANRPIPVTRMQAPPAPGILNQNVRAPEQTPQTLPGGQVTQPVPVVTLSKEAFDQLQGRTHEIHLTQTNQPPPLTRMQAPSAPGILKQNVRAPEKAQQTLHGGQVTQPTPVVTLSKEAFDQLQGRTHEIHLTQTTRPPPLTRAQAPPAPGILKQNVQVSEKAQQTLPGGPVKQPAPVVTLSKEMFDQLQGRPREIYLTQTDRPTPLTRVQAPPAPGILSQNVRAPEQARQTLPGGPVTQSTPVVTLSKEAFDQLQGRTHEIYLTQTDRPTQLTRVQASTVPSILNQNVRAPEQARQTLPVGPVTQHVPIVTLTKEAFDQLQGRTHEIHLTQTDRPAPLTRVQAPPASSILNQSVRVPEKTQQTLPVGPVTQPIPIITLSKEEFDQLQGGTHEIHFTQTNRPAPLTRVQAPPPPTILNQSVRGSVQASQTLSVGQVTQTIPIVTLTKEAFDQLQGGAHEIHFTQTPNRPGQLTRVQAPPALSNLNQSVRASVQTQQNVPVGPVTQPVPGQLVQAQSFQIPVSVTMDMSNSSSS